MVSATPRNRPETVRGETAETKRNRPETAMKPPRNQMPGPSETSETVFL